MPVFAIHQLVSATKGSITSDSISESESNEKKETTAEEEIHLTEKNVIKSQSQSPSEKEGKTLRFPCSYCSRRFETFEEVKRHVRNGHTPRRAG
jgi:hypothetical protein